ncbi:MAG: electron transport complex subunit RsxA [Candidatus Symbiodolus clandestinus]
MSDILLLLLSAVLVNNFVLVKFLGLCPLMGVSNKPETAVGLGFATTFILTLASAISYLVDRYLLQPWDLQPLRSLIFIMLIAAIVQFAELLMRKTHPLLYQLLGLFLPLITTNCAVLGVTLLNSRAAHSFTQAITLGMGSALGFTLVLLLFAGLRRRLQVADVPRPFQGNSIALITAGLLSLIFMGFSGWGRPLG